MAESISTGLGEYSKAKFAALIAVRSAALSAIRSSLSQAGYTEVSTSSLVNIAGSCENPNASFKLNYYGRDAHLSQSAQLQLEALVLRLHTSVFTVNNSFREENYDDPDMNGRRLSEFTLIEPEAPFIGLDPDEALNRVIEQQEATLQFATRHVLETIETEVSTLGGDIAFLSSTVDGAFNRIRYDDALELVNRVRGTSYEFGHDLNIADERAILGHFGNQPTFVTHFPASIKFFNMKRTADERRVYSVDLLMPRLGETVGGAVREDDGERIKRYLLSSQIAEAVESAGADTLVSFSEYLNIFDQEPAILRGGFGIGFERFVGFLLNSNDILETIAYRTMQPSAV